MTIDEEIEKAVYDLLLSDFADYESDVAIVPFVAETEDVERTIHYPAIHVACTPLVRTNPAGSLGMVQLQLSARTQAEDDDGGRVLQAIYEKANALITAANIGPQICDPWLLCGINDALDGEIAIDENTLNKGRIYQIAVADTT
jgi:hypothetical protein